MSRSILVIGPQGSGSSAVAGALHTFGIHMGDSLLGKTPLNPKGHFEDMAFRDLVEFSTTCTEEEKLDKRIEDYVIQRNKLSLWGLKMPQISTLGKYIVPHAECRVVSIDRAYEGCIRSSLLKYPEKTREEIEYMHYLVRTRREAFIQRYDLPNIAIDFNELTKNPSETIGRLREFCFEGMESPSEKAVEESIRFIDPKLNHQWECV